MQHFRCEVDFKDNIPTFLQPISPWQHIQKLVGPVDQLVCLGYWLQADDPAIRIIR